MTLSSLTSRLPRPAVTRRTARQSFSTSINHGAAE